MNRDTKEMTIAGKKFIFNTYLTGRESRDHQAIQLKAGTFNMEGKIEGGIDTSVLQKSADFLLSTLIVSVDEVIEKEAILNTVLDMRASEYEEVMLAIGEIANTEKKKAQ
jgi:DNA-binding winged helix-turn-helix (wHTH) protein